MIALFRCLATAALIVPTVIGCANDPRVPATSTITMGASPYERGDLGTLTYRAVDLMLEGAPEVGTRTPLVVASIADVQNLDSASALGNIVADMIRSRLVQDGRLATEMRLRGAVSFDKGTGEFMLSRNRRALMPPPNAAGIVAGTYAAGFQRVYVSLKLISATDARIMSAADFAVPLLDVVGLLPRFSSP
jgi:TolB-like protein